MEKGEAGAVYQRTGARASMHAKALAGQIAAAFVGTHAGRASLAVIDHDDDDSAAGRAFWKAIGEAKPACLPDIDAAQEDAFEQRAKGLIRLLRVDGGSQVECLHVPQFCLDLSPPSPSRPPLHLSLCPPTLSPYICT